MSYLPTASELIDRAIAEIREMYDEIERLTDELAEAREHAEWQRDRRQEHIGRFDITSRNQPFPWEQP